MRRGDPPTSAAAYYAGARPDKVARFLETAKGERLEALYVLAVTTGLRQGELLGLHWEDIDLVGAVLRVRHTLHELNGRMWLGEPKTPRARRQVDLPGIAVAALRIISTG